MFVVTMELFNTSQIMFKVNNDKKCYNSFVVHFRKFLLRQHYMGSMTRATKQKVNLK